MPPFSKPSQNRRRVHPVQEDKHGSQEVPPTCPAPPGESPAGHRPRDDRASAAAETVGTSDAPCRPPSKCSNHSTGSWRPVAENMKNHIESMREELPTLNPGLVVTKRSAQVNLLVLRNPKEWPHGDVDGGAGKPGMISAIDTAAGTCTVYWYESGEVHDCNIGRKGVLCKPCGNIPGSLGGNDGLASVGMSKAAMEAIRKLFGSLGKKGHQTTAPVEPFARQTSPFARQISPFARQTSPFARQTSPFARQISYAQYADKTQTAIIFDWDDTLFPTAFVKQDLGLSLQHQLKDQALRPQTMVRVRTALARAAGAADRLLRLASERGKVVIVTLGRSPWVTNSCKFFYPISWDRGASAEARHSDCVRAGERADRLQQGKLVGQGSVRDVLG
ncbi:unnamed protein product [Prorocentrum cordatum]|uniref:Uncharacterized protein n=1 Tax=Prorocentrum cordatum TaxID=2364126 RepID=A0ABN9WBE2_9DINO|nr:unnamed protein product [Polarella glacialis]